jgi:autoinducer 2-degrading protein
MHVVCVTVKVKPEMGDDFLKAIQENRAATRHEPGNIRFDILLSAEAAEVDDPEEYLLFEVYKTREDFTAHQQTAHYLKFRDTVAEMMAEPRKGAHYTVVEADPL